MNLRWLGSCVAVAAVLAAGSGWAAPADEDSETAGASSGEAKKRFVEGNERYSRGDYDGAIEAFKAAIAAEPKLPGPYRNLGLAYRALNRCAEAVPMYERYLELKPESRFTDRVRREIDLCRAKLGQAPASGSSGPTGGRGQGTYHPPEAQAILHVAANLIGGEATDEATVKVDGLVRGATPLTIPITPGTHKVHLSRVGFESGSANVDVGPGERRDVELTLNKLAVEPLPALARSPSEHPATVEEQARLGPRPSYKKYGWILLGVAAGTAAVGAGFGIAESALHRDAVSTPNSQITRRQVEDKHDLGNTYGAIAYTGLAVGGAALLAAAIVFLVDPSRGESHDKLRYVIAPAAGRDGGSLVATVRF
jgi:tetratricopeptide repeat protein/PEGA domain-containing protein